MAINNDNAKPYIHNIVVSLCVTECRKRSNEIHILMLVLTKRLDWVLSYEYCQ